MNWRELPFIRFFLPFVVGLLLPACFNSPLSLVPAFLIVLLLIAALLALCLFPIAYRWRHIYGILLCVGWLFLGSFHQSQSNQVDEIPALLPLHQSVFLQGTIKTIKARAKGPRVELQTQLLQTADTTLVVDFPLLLYLPIDTAKHVSIGQTISCKATIRPIEGPKNPFTFDFQAYMAQKGIHHQAFIQQGHWQVHQEAATASWGSYFYAFRQNALANLRRHLPTSETFGVGAALVLGYKDELTSETRSVYANTGAMHVLAVSGLHVGIIYLLLLTLFKLLPSNSRLLTFLQLGLTVLVIWSYAMLAGASPSVLRAACMFTFFAVAKALYRHSSIYNTLAVSAFVLLYTDPSLLSNIGFQLSYLAVIGIVFFQDRIYRAVYIRYRVLDYFWKLLSVGLAAQLTTLPLCIYYFHQIPLYSWLSGLIVVPAATLILSLGLLVQLTPALPMLDTVAGKILYFVIRDMNAAMGYIQQLPFAISKAWYWEVEILCLAYAALLCWMAAITTRNFRWMIATLSVGLLTILLFSTHIIQRDQQKELIIYHQRKESLFDLKWKQQIWSFNPDSLEVAQLSWSAVPYRSAKHTSQFFSLTLNTGIEQPHLQWQYPILQIEQTLLLLLDKTYTRIPLHTVPDIVLIRANSPIDASQLPKHKPIIFDASNSFRFQKRWKQQCQSHALNCHFTYEDGAFITPIK
ncbi:MAG: ComEC/Rec2 family competence protein [Bacteroidota bacterium]